MTRRTFTLILGLLPILFLSLNTVQAVEKNLQEGIVVWRLEPKSGVSEDDIDSISGILAAKVEEFSERSVISEADIQTILKGVETRQQCGQDEDTGCIAEIGAALGVPEAVSGDLGRVGGFWVLNLRRIKVRTADVLKRNTRQVEGSIDDLLREVPGAVAELFGKQAPVVVKPAPEPPPKQMGMSKMETGAYASFFSGLGLVAIGAVGTWQVKDAKDAGDKDRHSLWKGLSITGYTIGGAAMLAGIVLWALDANDADEKEQLSWIVLPHSSGASVQLAWTW